MFHTHRKTVFGIIVVSIAVLSMTGFGVNFFQDYERGKVYAIKIDDERIDFAQFDRERRQIQNRYRSMLGKNYAQLAPMLEANLNQQVVDKVISDNLVLKAARDNELYSGPEELQRILRTQVFTGGFDAAMYRQYLQEMNLSAPAFEREVRDTALRAQLVGILSDVTNASDEEARAMWEREETTYAVQYVEFDPARFEEQVDVSDVTVLEEYYTTNAADYEQPAKVSYEYVVLDPKKFEDLVVPTAEDIEMFYQDNQSRFMKPLEFRVRHIQLTFPKGAKPEEMATVKERATEALAKIQTGESFDAVATQYSDDLTSNTVGGDLGVIGLGKMSPEFDAALTQLGVGMVSELISTPYGFHIIKLEERREAEPKKLEEVRDSIVSEIRTREAPAYTADRAQQLFEEWGKGDGALANIATQLSLVVEKTSTALAQGADPAPTVRGLTEKVLMTPDAVKQLVELGAFSVLVQIKEYQEPSIPAFAEVKDRVTAAYRRSEAKRLASEAGARFIAAFAEDEKVDLSKVASEMKLAVLESRGISRAKPAAGALSDPAVQAAMFNTVTPLSPPTKVFNVGGKGYVVQVREIQRPDPAQAVERLAQYRTRATEVNTQNLIGSVLTKLKADATIDVDPQVVAQQG